MAEKMVVRAVARMASLEPEEVQRRYKDSGDMGELVEGMVESQGVRESGSHNLSAHDAYVRLTAIAEAGGEGSQETKIDLLADLLRQVGSVEAKYIARMVLGKMRLGFSDKTILDALAVMDGGTKQGREALDLAYQKSPDIGALATLVKEHGLINGAALVELVVGIPLMPALAQRLKTPDEMIAKMGKVIVDPKYDGARAQIHFIKDSLIKTFARSLEDTSAMFPELTAAAQQLKAKSVVIDCEAVGYSPETGKLLLFQETITRKRKYGVEALSKTLPVKFFCFDLLYLNGKSLLDRPLCERRQLLAEVVLPGEVLVVAPMMVTDSVEVLREYHKQQLGAGLEGAMVKKYDGVYQPGRTGWNWVKFKEVETASGKLSDTIDGIVMGYNRGKGKRSGFGIGAFLLGIWNETKKKYVTVAKVGTGLTDDQWREMKRRGDDCFAMEQPTNYEVPESLLPDVWLEPKVVVEVAADEITKSPLHTAGLGLRFPRLVRFRDDKRADQVTTKKELKTI
jgi:DNA ligase-1